MWKYFVRMAIPFLEAAGEEFIARDDNAHGKDDMIGQSLVYVAKLLRAILNDTPLPKAPDILK